MIGYHQFGGINSQMKPYYFYLYILLFSLCVLVSSSCTKSTQQYDTLVTEVNVLNDENAALSARIMIELTQAGVVALRYRIEGSEENWNSVLSEKSLLKHRISLLHLLENTTYEFDVLVNGKSVSDLRYFTTAKIPEWVKDFYNANDEGIVNQSEGYFLFSNMTSPSCTYVLDHRGQLVWYRIGPNVVKSVHMTADHAILMIEDENKTNYADGNIVLKCTLAGDTLFYGKVGNKSFDQMVHHDLKQSNAGNYVVITNTFKDGRIWDGLVKWSSSGSKIWEWNTSEFETYFPSSFEEQPWINSVFIDQDDHYLISLRAIHQIWKVHSKSGEVIWRLGENGDVVMDRSSEFVLQHYAHRNHKGDIMLFDNGHTKRPYSRILAFEIDERLKVAKTKIVVNVPSAYYSPIMGSVILLKDNCLLVTSSTTGTFMKLDLTGKLLWKKKVNGMLYRVEYLDVFKGV